MKATEQFFLCMLHYNPEAHGSIQQYKALLHLFPCPFAWDIKFSILSIQPSTAYLRPFHADRGHWWSVKDIGWQQGDIGLAGWGENTENMDEATTKWFRLTNTFIPPWGQLSENSWEKTRLPARGDAASSIQSSINKAEQTVLTAGWDSSVFVRPLICLSHTHLYQHQERPSLCLC